MTHFFLGNHLTILFITYLLEIRKFSAHIVYNHYSSFSRSQYFHRYPGMRIILNIEDEILKPHKIFLLSFMRTAYSKKKMRNALLSLTFIALTCHTCHVVLLCIGSAMYLSPFSDLPPNSWLENLDFIKCARFCNCRVSSYSFSLVCSLIAFSRCINSTQESSCPLSCWFSQLTMIIIMTNKLPSITDIGFGKITY